MTKVCVALSNFVIFSGVSTLGLLVWDQAHNDGNILLHTKKLIAEIKQSFITGDEQAVKAERPHDGKKSEVSGSSEKVESSLIQQVMWWSCGVAWSMISKILLKMIGMDKKGSSEIENEKKQSHHLNFEDTELD